MPSGASTTDFNDLPGVRRVGGNTVRVTASYTRPGDTNAYAAGDALANSTSAPVPLTFSGAVRNNGGSGVIIGAQLIDDSAPGTVGQFTLLLFSASPTATNDNAALSVSDSDALTLIGMIPFTTAKGATACTLYAPFALGDASAFAFVAGAGTTSIYGLVRMENAYTPANSGVLSFSLVIAQD